LGVGRIFRWALAAGVLQSLNKPMATDKVPTAGGDGLAQNPFAGLSSAGLPQAPKAPIAPLASQSIRKEPPKNRGRVDITRETGGRGGKTVSVVSGFVGIGEPEKDRLAKAIRGACGCGGTVKDGRIEIQGDQRETIARILTEAGFRPVFAGG
jgi:translation initiation factor 1